MTTTDGTIKRLTDRGFGFVVTSSARLYRTLRLSRFLLATEAARFPACWIACADPPAPLRDVLTNEQLGALKGDGPRREIRHRRPARPDPRLGVAVRQ